MTTPRFFHRKYSITANQEGAPLDQNFPMPAHSKYLRVLYHMWEHEEWDLLYLAGFGETISLIETENAKKAGKYALQPETIARVSAAWVNYELDGWHGG